MIEYHDIRDVHLELTTRCNAACPLCPRNFRGFPFNDGYPEVDLTLEQVKKIFTPEFTSQLESIFINGNFGDIVMHPEGADIVEYLRSCNYDMRIEISTNGSARNSRFWKKLANANARVAFCLDGLEDTHHLYRQNTSWKQIINNAGIFIQAGGYAIWKFVEFDHNVHQINECNDFALGMGFSKFQRVNHNRNIGPAFNKRGELVCVIGNYSGVTDFKTLLHHKKTDNVLLEDITKDMVPASGINCRTQEKKSIYIAATGDVFPCCWLGLYPATFGHGELHQAANAQVAPLIANNNALENTLQECISWFNNVKTSWNHSTYEQGRLVLCDKYCGIK